MTDAAFRREFGDQFFDRYWQLKPDWALAIGYYRYADRLIVPDATSRATAARAGRALGRGAARIDPATLSPAVRADWAMLENDFLSERWWLTELRAWQWNPSLYNVAEPFALLLDLEYAPLEERLRTFLARLANVPAYYAAAKGSIASPTVEHTQLAIEQNRGALDVFGAALERAIGASELARAERTAFATRLPAARAAIEDYVGWLEALEAQLAGGAVTARSFRLGRELYDAKFAFDNQSGETADALVRPRARREGSAARAHGGDSRINCGRSTFRRCGTERRVREDRPRHRAVGRGPCAAGAAAAGDQTADPRARALGARART